MKKLLTLLFALFVFGTMAMAQLFPLSISGTVSDANGNPEENVGIYIDVRVSPMGPSFYESTQWTDANGFYEDEIQITPNFPPQGILTVAMFDCDSTYQFYSFNYNSGNNSFVQDFTWCSNVLPACWVDIEVDSVAGSNALVLTAVPTGTPPFTYFWNNSGGTSNPSITVTQSGTYCVAVWDTTGCGATACVSVVINPPGNNCQVTIGADTINNTWILTAYPNGTAPFTYQWNTGEVTQSITALPNPAGINYCVTVTDATGCTASDCFTWVQPPSCSAYIEETAAGLTVFAIGGQAPYYYFWDTGESGQTIQPNGPGTYCATVIDADSCVATACYQYVNGCSVEIYQDSIPPGANGWELIAVAQGTPPFTYQWDSNNQNSPNIFVTQPGTYCSTVTDATGCVATNCITVGFYPCQVDIVETVFPNSLDTVLLAVVPANAYWYEWSTGDTLPYIVPSGPGTYCVTVTHSSGCTASACYEYGQMFGNFTVKGFVTAEGSSPNLTLQGTVYLYEYDSTAAALTLYGQTALLPDPTLPPLPNGNAYYDFGAVPQGEYLALALLAPNTPGSDDYLPTYYGDVQTWQEASHIIVSHNGQLFNITLTKGDSLSGPGTINGFVSEGPGFHGGGNDRGDAVEGASVLLFDEAEKPLSYRLSASDGGYTFEELPYGTYKLVVDIPGLPATAAWVTISPDQAAITVNFDVNDQGVTDAHEAILNAAISLWPNPAGQTLKVRVNATENLNATVEIISTLGQVLRSEQKAIAAGETNFSIDTGRLSPGIYLLSLRNGNERIVRRFAKK
ncbi:MAG: hypothetical protein CMN32_17135 [Saprospirales bacterium]|nr:hypothetical protein [Saprospirales bacterium]